MKEGWFKTWYINALLPAAFNDTSFEIQPLSKLFSKKSLTSLGKEAIKHTDFGHLAKNTAKLCPKLCIENCKYEGWIENSKYEVWIENSKYEEWMHHNSHEQ